MKKLPVIAVALALGCAGTAEAKTLTLKGGVKGDSNSKVALKLKVTKDGIPTKVINLTYAGIDTYAATSPGQTGEPCDIGEQQGTLPGAEPSITRPSPGSYRFNAVEQRSQGPAQALGALTPYPKAKKGSGYVQFVDGTSVCASKEFKLHK